MQYLLDIETLLLFLSSRRQSGELTTSLKRFPGLASRGACHVRITLLEGKVTACTIYNDEGNVLVEGEDALQRLKKMGQLDWAWRIVNQTDAFPAVPALSAPARVPQHQPLDRSSLIYRRIIPIDTINKMVLTRRHRQVLLLVDSARTAAQIASVLSSSPSEAANVLKILEELHQRGILAIVTASQ
jgi:hypothetical protein